jgi:FtsP/CotA-like multicopper oxidase with cupredoxin domain
MATENKSLQAKTTVADLEDPGRRQFVGQALAASAAVALSGLIPEMKAAPPPPACTPVLGQELVNPGEIKSDANGLLQAVLRVHGEQRQVSYMDVISTSPPQPACGTYMLRAYEGYQGPKIEKSKMVTKPGVYGPGPTFRASVGDKLEIALLNHIDPQQFPESPNGACDTVTDATTGTQIYPGSSSSPDHYPDCFRGSNTTNLHFHGTHVSPNAFSDNVLVEIVPDLNATPEDCQPLFPIACKDYPNPQAWKHQDAPTQQALSEFIQHRALSRLEQLDQTQPERNDKDLHKRQAEQNRRLQQYDEFPQYWAGCFPYCIRPPKWVQGGNPQYSMGQSPGTHWYHAHKHGSTAIQVFNGMAGALILQGDYDKVLQDTMKGVQEKVLVIQQFQPQPNRERTGGPGGAGGKSNNNAGVLVNGQLMPTITMKTGEVQWWRIINATVQGGKDAFFLCKFEGAGAPTFFQTAQDGVQLDWKNYQPQLTQPQKHFILAPGNRVDILVKAPDTKGSATLRFDVTGTTGGQTAAQWNILTVNTVEPISGLAYNRKWPQTIDQYPKMPPFLRDINDVTECRWIRYQMAKVGSTPTINGKTFQEHTVDEAMLLETSQEWIIENYSTVNSGIPMHPFHIHVNPFQIVEIYDPSGKFSAVFPQATNAPWKLPAPWVWWDTFPIPLGVPDTTVPGGVKPGYFRMRTHFADFAGRFVNHCHILAHEDRGMMQLIEVVDNKTQITHH